MLRPAVPAARAATVAAAMCTLGATASPVTAAATTLAARTRPLATLTATTTGTPSRCRYRGRTSNPTIRTHPVTQLPVRG